MNKQSISFSWHNPSWSHPCWARATNQQVKQSWIDGTIHQPAACLGLLVVQGDMVEKKPSLLSGLGQVVQGDGAGKNG